MNKHLGAVRSNRERERMKALKKRIDAVKILRKSGIKGPSGVSQAEEDKCHIDFTYLWNLMNKINVETKQKQTHRCREQTDWWSPAGRDLGGWMKKVKEFKNSNW